MVNGIKLKKNCQFEDVVLLRGYLERYRWPMAEAFPVNNDVDGDVLSVRQLIGASYKSNQYLERLVNKFVVFVEHEDEDDN